MRDEILPAKMFVKESAPHLRKKSINKHRRRGREKKACEILIKFE